MTTFRELRASSRAARGAGPAEEIMCFLIHHAGGSSVSFVDFPRLFPPGWRLRAVELPGRGLTASSPPFRSTAEAVEKLLPDFLEEATGPYAIFGHSMGALIAYELARELERCGRPPVWLGVSAMPAPGRVAGRFEERRDLWPRERLVTFMRSLGGTPDEMLRDADLVDYMVEILRSDLIVVDTYEYVERPPLGVPLSVFSGEQDPLTAKDLVEGWGQYCTEPVTFHSLPGGHFFLFDQVERFTQCLIKDIGKVLAARRVDEGTGACFLPRKVPVPMNPEP